MYTIKKHAGEGSRSSFYKLNQRGKGFKTFLDREDAEYAHAIQSELSLNDLAPKVYSEVGRIRIGNRLSPWGYITEVAKTITPHGVSCECSRCEDIEDKYSEEIAELQNDIEDAGYYFGDAHTGNVGFVRRKGYNILVCIDTGRESVEEWENERSEYSCECYECRKYREEQYA